jgi:histidinol-phosphate phosphatase family protein
VSSPVRGARAVFLDRDGTINLDVVHCSRVEDFHILRDVPEAIGRLNRAGFRVVVITNQSAVARGLLTEQGLARIHEHMREWLARRGAHVDAVYYCPHGPDDGCDCRKPKPGLLAKATRELGIDPTTSYMIGDSERDVQAGASAGCQTVLISPDGQVPDQLRPDHVAHDLLDAVLWLLAAAQARKS